MEKLWTDICANVGTEATFNWGPFLEVDSGEWGPWPWRYYTLASIIVCLVCHSNPLVLYVLSGIGAGLFSWGKLTERRWLAWTRALKTPLLSRPQHINHLPAIPPMARTSAGLGGLSHGVTWVMITKRSEPMVILPFVSIYHQIKKGIIKSFLSGLSRCQPFSSLVYCVISALPSDNQSRLLLP